MFLEERGHAGAGPATAVFGIPSSERGGIQGDPPGDVPKRCSVTFNFKGTSHFW